nr:hypothetical protein [uncultured Anaeromusa sp.]
MGLVKQQVKNMVQGISQQPAVLRFPEQLEEQCNGLSNGPLGLQKRPPLVHVASLPDDFLGASVVPFTHSIDRDKTERYHVVFDGTGIKIVHKDGSVKVVTYTGAAQGYIQTPTPAETLKAVTIADYTFVLNTAKTTTLTADKTSTTWDTQGGLINVKSGQYGRTYQVLINDVVVADFTTPDGSQSSHITQIDTNYIASQLASDLNNAGYATEKGEGWVYIKASITKLSTRDGYNNQAMFGFLRATQKFSNLPQTAPDGFTVLVKGNNESNTDDYYVRYSVAEGLWKECAKPGILSTYDPVSMPHILVREANGTFSFSAANWDKREVGDDDSNPQASFVGRQITDVFFVRNRLGLLAGENCILSKTGEFFKFWMTTATNVLDSDMIDQAVPDESVANLNFACTFAEELLLFSDTAQFVGHSDTVFSPKNFRIDKVTSFDSIPSCKPYAAGRRVYFANQRATESSIYEYYIVEDVSSVKDAQDISGHVPKLIPNTVYKIIGSNSENILLAFSTLTPSRCYVYKYFWAKEQRVQASWSYWDFGSAQIISAAFFGSTLSVITKRNGKFSVEQAIFTVNTKDLPAEPYRVFLDRKKTYTIPVGSFDPLTYQTVFTVKATYGADVPNTQTYGACFSDGFYTTVADGTSTQTIRVNGNREGQTVIVGEVINWWGAISQLMVKNDDGKGGIQADASGTLKVSQIEFQHADSGLYSIRCAHDGKQTFEYTAPGRVLGASGNIIGETPVNSGSFAVPVGGDSRDVTITYNSISPSQVSLIGFTWFGRKTSRGGRSFG